MSEQTARGAYRATEVSRGHLKPVETSRANRKVRKTHPGEGPNRVVRTRTLRGVGGGSCEAPPYPDGL